MKKIVFISSLIVTILGLQSCVQLLPMALDTANDNDPYFAINNTINVDYIEKFTATDIYTDILSNTWGFEKDACREFITVDSVKKGGASSLLMSWDNSKKGCDWIGGAFAWNNWQSVDMSTIIDTWAIRFWVRTKQGTMNKLPISISFLDDSDKRSETVDISNKFFSGEIDETWKEVIVPLAYFRCKATGVNVSGITQLIMSFSGKASIYFDEFQFIDLSTIKNYSPANNTTTETSASKFEFNTEFTQTDIFTDMIEGGTWGFEKDACREFVIEDNIKKNGSSSLHLKWNNTSKDCNWIGAGWAWNNWQPVDMSNVVDTWGLHFWVRTETGELDKVPLTMNFIDTDDKSTSTISISNRFFEGDVINENWKEVIVPLTYFSFRAKGLDISHISQLIFSCQESGSIFIDDFNFIDLSHVKGYDTPFTATNVYTDKIENAWGFNNDACRTFETVDSVKKNGDSSLLLKWDTSVNNCNFISLGFAWNNWNPINATSIIDTYALHFWIRTNKAQMQNIPIEISIQDNTSTTTELIALSTKYLKGEIFDTNWQEVTIPLSDFKFKEIGLNLFEISQLIFSFEDKGFVYMDDIEFIKIK